jgi:hypothetical protein
LSLIPAKLYYGGDVSVRIGASTQFFNSLAHSRERINGNAKSRPRNRSGRPNWPNWTPTIGKVQKTF